MQCNFVGLSDLILWLVLSILALLIGYTGLRRPDRVRYWFEWIHWKQTQWFLGIPPDRLSAPQKSLEENHAQHPKGAKMILQVLFGCMTVLGVIFLISWIGLLLQFLCSCL